jgi:hypothetical protein
VVSLARTVETENREPRSESSQPRQGSGLRNGHFAGDFDPGYSFDSGNWRRQTVSSNPVLWSLRVSLVLLRLRHRSKWIHPHLLPKNRGYVPAIIMMVLSIGTTVPDVLGLLPPSAPTLRTSVLMLSVLPLAILLVYVSWKAFHVKVSQASSSKMATPPNPRKS